METVVTPDMRDILKKEFSKLKDTVVLKVFTKKGLNDRFNEFTVSLTEEFSSLSKKIKTEYFSLDSGEARRYGIDTSPVILISPDRYKIRFMGAPMGEEGKSIVAGVVLASQGKGLLSAESAKRLKELGEPREIMVFVSPTCPYCPQQVVYAISSAIEAPDKVSVKVVEIYENRTLAERYQVVSVPQTVINGNVVASGVQPEEVFTDSLFAGAPVEIKAAPAKGEVIKKDVVIVGAGPGGLTAAIYAERAGLSTVVLEKGNIGGQVAVTPVVENYPGYTRIPGKTLMDMMAQQAIQYTEIHQGEEVLDIRKEETYFEIKSTSNIYEARAIILATGAKHRKLGAPGEERFFGRGVSYCATCDGYFFKDGRKVIMLGGGNAAVTEALYLESLGVDVTLVHRQDKLRAEERLQQNLKERGIPVLWNTVVEEIMGDAVVNAVKLKNLKEKRSYVMDIDGVFIAIGYEPLNGIARKLKLKLSPEGYIVVDERQRTSLRGVYAAGDITGGIKQIVTAVGQGSVAALTAFEDLTNPYWKKTPDS
ncbi:thioredoxin reductase [bacterium BMS3Bbin06]|nr:thioredoxin reductase [bacterium BMS3Bbin06]